MSTATSTAASVATRGAQLADYIATATGRALPEAVRQAVRRALIDHLACALGAVHDPAVRAVRHTAARWQARGTARIYLGGRTTPALAALVNGTMAHAMDYDDTHPGGPCWSTALALAGEAADGYRRVVPAFVAGYEVMARLGGGGPPGVGRSLQRRGLHPTSVVGRVGAAATACVMLGLDRGAIAHALGAAATTAGGLLGSFGTHGKPFHAGKAAMDGILAAQLAADGFVAATDLYETGQGLLGAFIQDGDAVVPPLDFGHWELLDNGLKLYASCRATHASAQAARSLAPRIGARAVRRVRALIHPNGLVTAGRRAPATALEGKFSIPFCIALGLRGYTLAATDFVDAVFADERVTRIVPLVELEAVDGQPAHEAHLFVELEDGERLQADTDVVRGVPQNPLSEAELAEKFHTLVAQVAGPARAAELYRAASAVGDPATLPALLAALAPDSASGDG
ncbi:MmgE/PrpD family protein [Pseudothauera rhizosphaerae]|uniref:MmgE/PrpD family protein n=1 Tax=Pseudothauera rhizosphaerae TaxID=2565932 RepID=A0A4S4AG19_9RHOO|nr:MmgE/PrpD family protein [Pseudothauera rhizosphaerae]THF57208.1 MmgE/PrpD family protein [Pseudothauera rhizosphaerae]